jgi:hypothetical protein
VDTASNLFLRRFRIMFAGKMGKWGFFFETDNPNLGKADLANRGIKNTGFVYIQDAFVTYNHKDAFKVDAGMLLIGATHNQIQGATSLLPVDYGPYSFANAAATESRVGRDYGVQLRGYPAKQKLEYRLGVFQGVRGERASNGLRVTGRAVFYPFSAETGYFYGGTNQGTKQVLAIGAGFDIQSGKPAATATNPAPASATYKGYGADIYFDQPIGGGKTGVTLQGDYLHFDGDTFLPSLAKQNDLLLEAGVHLGSHKFAPFVQFAMQNYDAAARADNRVIRGGIAWWIKGHSRNLKISAGQIHAAAVGTTAAVDKTELLAQLQVLAW